MSPIPRPCLCLVTDRRRLIPGARTRRDELLALERWLDEAIDAGIDLIQIRERDLDASILRAVAGNVANRARGTPTLVVVNDRADVAVAAGAAGVHLRADGPPVERIRALGPTGWIVGRSVHTVDEVRRHASADYLIFGTVFPSASKGGGAPAQGIAALTAAVQAAAPPVLAIGGVTIDRAVECAAAGAAGIAAIGLFLPEGQAPEALGAARAVRALRATG
jgi:thiamine-phosphate pyrophosphorylase